MQKTGLLFGFASLLLVTSNVLAMDVTVVNHLGGGSGCPGGNSLTLFFNGGGQKYIAPGASGTVSGNFAQMPGLGIQVNNWYWASVSLPIQRGNPQNPDNSGGQFTVDGNCRLNMAPAWYGKGVPTWKIARVTAQKAGNGCRIVVSSNDYTSAVTPGCCAPPGIGGNTCRGPYGRTNNGKSWPPR